MLDIKWIRENAKALDTAMKNRGASAVSSSILELDEKRRAIQLELQELQSRRNVVSKEVGIAKGKGEDASHLFEEMKTLGPKVKELEEAERQALAEQNDMLSRLPNIPADDVPEGADEDDNVEVHKWAEPTKLAFEAKAHDDLGETLGLMDSETAAKVAGSRFTWLKGDLARLERALGNFMIDTHTQKNGFEEVAVPVLVNPDSMFGTGQYPKFGEDAFITNDERDLAMVPTAEVPLTNAVRGEILKESDLPIRMAAWTQCFRKEAGSAGKDTRGYIRQHQFGKVEMVQIVHPEKSWEALEFMRECAQGILEDLKLPYRTVTLCSGDLGFGAKKTYDIEVWLPAQDTYREISSCSNCGDFQARRMKARFKNAEGKTEFVHTLNGSGLATGRTLVAVMENYQNEDGSITVPEVLRPYMGGLEVIKAVGEK